MKTALAHLDATVVESIPTSTWRDVFDAIGWPKDLKAKAVDFVHEDVLAHLLTEPSDALLELLEAVHELGTEQGREVVVSAMKDRRVQLTQFPDDIGAPELAVSLYLQQRNSAQLADVYHRALVHTQKIGATRAYNEFMGKESKDVSETPAETRAFEKAIRAYCNSNDLGDHVHVKSLLDDDAVLIVRVIRSHRTAKPLAVAHGEVVRRTIQYRPVHSDLIRYDCATGRVRIAARLPSMIEFYRIEFGRTFFGDEEFFTDKPTCDLSPLQQRRRSALDDHGVFGIFRVRMTECTWQRGDREIIQIRSDDCFRNFEELSLPIHEGAFLQAKLKMDVAGSSRRPITVNLRMPSRIEIVGKREESLVDEFLVGAGIHKSPKPESDLWTLAPWRHARTVWTNLFGGSAVDQLLGAGVLKPVRLESVFGAHGPAGVHPLPVHGDHYAIGENEDVAPYTVSKTDLDGFELKPDAFRKFIATSLGASEGIDWDEREFLNLGRMAVGDCSVRLLYAVRRPTQQSDERLGKLSQGDRCVVLVPGESAAVGSNFVRCSVLPTRERIAVSVASTLDIRISAREAAPASAQLVVDTHINKMWVHGIEVGLSSDAHPFSFAKAVASARGPVSTVELARILSPHRVDGTTVVRQAKNGVERSIRQALENAGMASTTDAFKSEPRGHYRCVLRAFVK